MSEIKIASAGPLKWGFLTAWDLGADVVRDMQNKQIYRVFPRFAGALNKFVPFLHCMLITKNQKTKFEIEEENTKLQIARKLPW